MSTRLPQLTRDQFIRLNEIGEALANGKLPASALQDYLRGQDPEVQQHVTQIIRTYDNAASGGGATLPFEHRITTKEVADHFHLDDAKAEAAYQRLYDHELTDGLIRRMGSDADLPTPTEPTLRESVAAALEAHSQE